MLSILNFKGKNLHYEKTAEDKRLSQFFMLLYFSVFLSCSPAVILCLRFKSRLLFYMPFMSSRRAFSVFVKRGGLCGYLSAFVTAEINDPVAFGELFYYVQSFLHMSFVEEDERVVGGDLPVQHRKTVAVFFDLPDELFDVNVLCEGGGR